MTSTVTRTARVRADDDTVHFGLVELDLLATHAGVPFPFPLRVPSFGRLAGEREVLLAAAGQTLRIRQLADEDGPVGAAAELVAALRQHRSTVDLVLVDTAGATGIVAVVYRSWALICVQPLNNDPATTVGIRRVAANALADALLEMVPEVSPARAMPISLPNHAVQTATRLIDGVEDDTEKEWLLRDLVRDSGGDARALDNLVSLLPTVVGRGQLGATRRTERGSVRAGTELSWLDGPHGRVRVDCTRNGWLSINPLRQADLRYALDDLAAIARKP
jgi:ESAT-6 protein secretion system EspG family protein